MFYLVLIFGIIIVSVPFAWGLCAAFASQEAGLRRTLFALATIPALLPPAILLFNLINEGPRGLFQNNMMFAQLLLVALLWIAAMFTGAMIGKSRRPE